MSEAGDRTDREEVRGVGEVWVKLNPEYKPGVSGAQYIQCVVGEWVAPPLGMHSYSWQ